MTTQITAPMLQAFLSEELPQIAERTKVVRLEINCLAIRLDGGQTIATARQGVTKIEVSRN